MKTLILSTLLTLTSAYAHSTCKTEETSTSREEVARSAVATPSERAQDIITVYSHGTIYKFDPSEYMVARRLRATKTVTKIKDTKLTCGEAAAKNLVTLGIRQDYLGTETSTNGQEVTVRLRRGPVTDLQYYRNEIVGPVGAGVGIDTRGTPKALIGVGF